MRLKLKTLIYICERVYKTIKNKLSVNNKVGNFGWSISLKGDIAEHHLQGQVYGKTGQWGLPQLN